MEMSTSPKVCGVCLEDYNESERCPRILICSHTLCSRCVEDLISNNKKECPFCRREFVANNPDDVIVNLAALELIKYLAERDSDSWERQKSSSVSLLGQVGELKREALEISRRQSVHCGEKQQEAEYKIQEIECLSDTIIQENETIEKDILLKFQKAVADNCRTLEELNQTRMQLQEQIKEIQSQKENLDDVIQKIQTTTAETFKEISGILDEAEEVNLSVSKWKNNFQKIITNANKSLETKRKRVTRDCKISSTILELLNSPDKSEAYIESIEKSEAMAIRDDDPAEDFQGMSDNTKERRVSIEFQSRENEQLTQEQEEKQKQQEEQRQLLEEQQQQEQQKQQQKQKEKQREQRKHTELQKAKQRLQLQKKQQQQQKTKEEQELELLKKQLQATQSLNFNLLVLRQECIKVKGQSRTNHSVSYSSSRYYDDF